MSCYETATTYSTPPVRIANPPIPVDWNYSPFGNFPSLSGKWPRTQNLYTVPFNPTMVKYSPAIYGYGALNGVSQVNTGDCANNMIYANAYLSCKNN
jgi:hypothetical protein